MSAIRIINSLETLDLTGAEADAAARLGFLEWALSDADDVTAAKAGMALETPEAQNPESAAAQAFVDYLRQARLGMTTNRRRKGRTRHLH